MKFLHNLTIFAQKVGFSLRKFPISFSANFYIKDKEGKMADQKHVFSEDIESNQSLSKTPVMNFKVDDIEVVINQPTVVESCEEGKQRLASYIMYLSELSADEN